MKATELTISYNDIISDSRRHQPDTMTIREQACRILPKKATVAIGMRRTGKSYFFHQHMNDLIKTGRDPDSILFVNFEDDRLMGMNAKNLRELIEQYFLQFPQFRVDGCVFMFDEIQVVEAWQQVVRSILDQEKAQVFLTGSSAKLLSTEIATNLRGRSIAIEIFPFSFSEFLSHKGITHKNSSHPAAEMRSRLQHELRNYLAQGGFPEVINLDNIAAREVLQGYVDTLILRDVVERHKVTALVPLRQMLLQILSNPSALLSINKLHGDMHSRGIAVSKDTLYAMAGHLEDAYLFQATSIHSTSERVRQTNPRKIYPIDTGLAMAYMRASQRDIGKLLETATFMALRRFCKHIDYYRTQDGYEVDFIIQSHDFEDILIQACAQMDTADTRERELRALQSAMKEKKQKIGFVVTLELEEKIKCPEGLILVIPAWKFFLEPQHWLSEH